MNTKYSNCSVVLPAYNEEESIGPLLEEIISLSLFGEIIVVNDCSTDSTKQVVQRFSQVTLVNNHVNLGNGASVRKGMATATGDYLVLLDADGQHPPKTIKRLVDYAIKCEYDLVVASRKANKNVSMFRSFGNRLLEAFAWYITGEKIEDLTSGFRVFRRSSVMKIVHLFPQRYSYPTTSILGMLALGYSVGYLAIPEIKARAKGESGINPFKDFFRFLKIMIRLSIVFAPAKIFLPFAFFIFSLGLIDIGITLYFFRNIQELGVLLIILSFIISVFAVFGEQLSRIRIEIGMVVANEIEDRSNKKK
jgi:glycosyltransferase involved in cell wall biosynthesis